MRSLSEILQDLRFLQDVAGSNDAAVLAAIRIKTDIVEMHGTAAAKIRQDCSFCRFQGKVEQCTSCVWGEGTRSGFSPANRKSF